ncbi:MAG: J domain-containing protein [Spirochaetes bacterium]|nr:MAG: J domain-containing protein [Spirochaetota bacterium]
MPHSFGGCILNENRIKEIAEAAKILGLPERATLQVIKDRYRELVKKWHPDSGSKNEKECREMIRKINKAYKIITDFINNYKYPLSGDAILDEEAYIQRRFGNDPIWS